MPISRFGEHRWRQRLRPLQISGVNVAGEEVADFLLEGELGVGEKVMSMSVLPQDCQTLAGR